MADELFKCGTDTPDDVNWENVVGDRTLENGGYIGDLLTISRVHLEDAKRNGELTEANAGTAYSALIQEAIQEAIRFELNKSKSQLELCYLQAQIDKLECDCENDKCRAAAECALKAAQTIKVGEETSLVIEQTESEDKNNMPDGMIDQQIIKMIADVELAETKAALEHAKAISEIDKVMGYNYTIDSDGDIVVGSSHGNGKLDADVAKSKIEVKHIEEQTDEIPKESARRDCTSAAECKTKDAQIDKLECECENDTNMTASKLSLNAAHENKLACDCCNSSKLADAQSSLYLRQQAGFEENANQKIYDSQLQAWSMVFADTDMDDVTASIKEPAIGHSYNRIQASLDARANFTNVQY